MDGAPNVRLTIGGERCSMGVAGRDGNHRFPRERTKRPGRDAVVGGGLDAELAAAVRSPGMDLPVTGEGQIEIRAGAHLAENDSRRGAGARRFMIFN